jgi:WD40 repeat protein
MDLSESEISKRASIAFSYDHTMDSNDEMLHSDYSVDDGNLIVEKMEEDTDDGNLIVQKVEEDAELSLQESSNIIPPSPSIEPPTSLRFPSVDVELIVSKAPPPKPNYKHRYTLSGHTMSVSSLKFGPSGSVLASSGVFAYPLFQYTSP